MGQVSSYWGLVVRRSWRRSLELVRLESAERIIVFLIGLLVPAVVAWFVVGHDTATVVRLLASLGASFVALTLMFVWSLIKLPAVLHAEAEASRKILEDQRETEEKKAQKRERLGAFLARGTELMSASRNQRDAPPEDEANEWLRDLLEYLETNFGPAYVARVNDGGSAPVGFSSSGLVYNGIRIRVFHLQEFLKEMGSP